MTTFDAAKARCPIHGNEWCTCVHETDPSVAQINKEAIKIMFSHEANCAVHSPTLRPCSCGLETRMRDEIIRLRASSEWFAEMQKTIDENNRQIESGERIDWAQRHHSACCTIEELNATLSAQSAEIGRLRGVVEKVEWIGKHNDYTAWSECPLCYNSKDQGHTKDCELAAALSPKERA